MNSGDHPEGRPQFSVPTSGIGAALDREARIAEHLTDAELYDRNVANYAERLILADGWWAFYVTLDPRMRSGLIKGGGLDPEFADAVISKLREIGEARDAKPGRD